MSDKGTNVQTFVGLGFWSSRRSPLHLVFLKATEKATRLLLASFFVFNQFNIDHFMWFTNSFAFSKGEKWFLTNIFMLIPQML